VQLNSQFPLPDSPYVLVAGIVFVAAALFVAMYLSQRRNQKKIRLKLEIKQCSHCRQVYGKSFKMTALDQFSSRSLQTPRWLWVVTCPHCGRKSQFTPFADEIES
jgi:hypothetical protein